MTGPLGLLQRRGIDGAAAELHGRGRLSRGSGGHRRREGGQDEQQWAKKAAWRCHGTGPARGGGTTYVGSERPEL